MNVVNCSRCGKIFMKTIHDICPACLKDIEVQYDKVYKYIRDNRQATMKDVSEATEVSVNQIMRFIREGRISIGAMPNMNYPCESCGEPIREHQMCVSCRQKLAKEMSNSLEDAAIQRKLTQQENQVSFNIQDRLKKDRFR